jgi:hypothetical protein
MHGIASIKLDKICYYEYQIKLHEMHVASGRVEEINSSTSSISDGDLEVRELSLYGEGFRVTERFSY